MPFSETLRSTALLQLCSPSLPIGGYSYSQGLEAAAHAGLVRDEASARRWIQGQLDGVLVQCEAPIWLLMFDAWANRDWSGLSHWNEWFHASRETHELRQETEQMGWSLMKLAKDLDWGEAKVRDRFCALPVTTLPAAHAYAAYALDICRENGLAAYLFSWLENQVMAAIKTIPLGQAAGQRILDGVRRCIPGVCEEALVRAAYEPPRLSTLAPQFAILSSRHESQYSRLFRS
jgi:urease accessory protein